jgi:hypothetical protein
MVREDKIKKMMQKYIVPAAAWLEIGVGIILVAGPGVPCTLLFGSKPDSIGAPLARWVGVALFALGIACLPSKETELQLRPVLGLLVFNLGIAVLLAWVGAVATMHGFLLWPGVILHALISVTLLSQLKATSRTGKK